MGTMRNSENNGRHLIFVQNVYCVQRANMIATGGKAEEFDMARGVRQ